MSINRTDAFGSYVCLRKKLSYNSFKNSYTNIKCVGQDKKQLGCVKGFFYNKKKYNGSSTFTRQKIITFLL